MSDDGKKLASFAATVAREINNPLTIILCASERLLADAPQGSSIRAGLCDIERAAMRCAEITDDLLSYTKQKSANGRIELSWFIGER